MPRNESTGEAFRAFVQVAGVETARQGAEELGAGHEIESREVPKRQMSGAATEGGAT